MIPTSTNYNDFFTLSRQLVNYQVVEKVQEIQILTSHKFKLKIKNTR